MGFVQAVGHEQDALELFVTQDIPMLDILINTFFSVSMTQVASSKRSAISFNTATLTRFQLKVKMCSTSSWCSRPV
jgi:hypothetical protein